MIFKRNLITLYNRLTGSVKAKMSGTCFPPNGKSNFMPAKPKHLHTNQRATLQMPRHPVTIPDTKKKAQPSNDILMLSRWVFNLCLLLLLLPLETRKMRVLNPI